MLPVLSAKRPTISGPINEDDWGTLGQSASVSIRSFLHCGTYPGLSGDGEQAVPPRLIPGNDDLGVQYLCVALECAVHALKYTTRTYISAGACKPYQTGRSKANAAPQIAYPNSAINTEVRDGDTFKKEAAIRARQSDLNRALSSGMRATATALRRRSATLSMSSQVTGACLPNTQAA